MTNLVRLISIWLLTWMASAALAEVNLATKSTAILAGGCFWCVESDFEELPGVIHTVSGYTGGTIANPTYENYHDADGGKVSHVEAVEITYDSTKLGYPELLDFYFRHIDPTDGGGQFCDRGAAYRPVIFVNGASERAIAEQKKLEVQQFLKKPIAVDILPAQTFWPAEDYHQDYHKKNPARYSFYRWNCGRDQRVKAIWGKR